MSRPVLHLLAFCWLVAACSEPSEEPRAETAAWGWAAPNGRFDLVVPAGWGERTASTVALTADPNSLLVVGPDRFPAPVCFVIQGELGVLSSDLDEAALNEAVANLDRSAALILTGDAPGGAVTTWRRTAVDGGTVMTAVVEGQGPGGFQERRLRIFGLMEDSAAALYAVGCAIFETQPDDGDVDEFLSSLRIRS